MKSKNIRPALSRDENANFVRELFSMRSSNFGVSLPSFIIDTANLTEEIFASRYKKGVRYMNKEIRERCEVIWHLALLSLAQHYSGLTFEEVMKRSHIEIAGAVCLVNQDMRLPIDQRVPRYACNLSVASNLVKVAAFSRVLSSILALTEDVEFRNIDHEQLFELAWLLKEFRVFSGWSKLAQSTWLDCADIVNSWSTQGILKWDLPTPSLHFTLDPSIRISNLRLIFEP